MCISFLRKGYERKKAPNAKQTTFTILEVFVRAKTYYLCCFLFACFCVVGWFLLVTCFCAREIFWEKKNELV